MENENYIDYAIINRFKNKIKKTNPELSYAFEERAAIMQYDGGLSKKEAEQKAFEIIMNEHILSESEQKLVS
jgi:hypothetical protein